MIQIFAMRVVRIACVLFGLAISAPAAPFRLLAIGDSLTEEYRFETPFSAPDSKPFVANTKNWVELLHAHRPTFFSMGGYEPSLGNYADYRNAGYEYNYGVPGFKAEKWDQILNDPDFADFSTWFELRRDLSAVDGVLIFIGGNDLSLTNSEAQHDVIRQHIGRIHDWVRANAPADLPIIVATVPDIGATPKEKIADPATAAAARRRVETLNSGIAAFGSRPNTYIARIDALTDFIFDTDPIHLNGTEFSYPPNPENPPLTFFCKMGFHPATAGQALIANRILQAINRFVPFPIPEFTNREILTILGQNPDQPYLNWAVSAGGMQENPDGDTLPNLLEYVLGTPPSAPNPAFSFLPDGSALFAPSPPALRFADLDVLQSTTLENDWTPVPAANISISQDGSRKIIPTAPKLFYKLQATPKP